METIRPSNICAGFKKCGIFPFDPKAIECTSSPKLATTPTTSAELNDGKNFNWVHTVYINVMYFYTQVQRKMTLKSMKHGIARDMISMIPSITNG